MLSEYSKFAVSIALSKKALKLILLLSFSTYLISCKAGGTVEESYTPISVSSYSLSEDYVAGGSSITFLAKDSTSETKVYIGGEECEQTSRSVDDSTSIATIVCNVPAHAQGVVDISLVDFREKIISGAFTYWDPLEITSVTNSSGFLDGEYSVTLAGKGFRPGMTVTVGGNSCDSLTINSVFEAVCDVPAGNNGQVDVVLTNTNSDTVTSTNGFEYKIDALSRIDILAESGSLSPMGNDIGAAKDSRFYLPTDVQVYNTNELFISDSMNNVIKKLNLTTNQVTVVAGQVGISGDTDNAVGTSALLNKPTMMHIIGSTMYFSDTNNCAIKTIDLSDSNYPVTSWAGGDVCSSTNAFVPGTGTATVLSHLWGIESDDSYLYVANSSHHIIVRIDLATKVATKIAGSGNWTAYGCSDSLDDNPATMGGLASPFGLKKVGTTIYITGGYNHSVIRTLDISNTNYNLGTLSATCGSGHGFSDGIATAVKLKKAGGIESDGTYLYISDTKNNLIRKVTIADGSVTSIVGDTTNQIYGLADDIGTAARLYRPGGMSLDGSNLYFIGIGNHNVRKLDLTTLAVSTLAGQGAQ